jgi:hypothetical protein
MLNTCAFFQLHHDRHTRLDFYFLSASLIVSIKEAGSGSAALSFLGPNFSNLEKSNFFSSSLSTTRFTSKEPFEGFPCEFWVTEALGYAMARTCVIRLAQVL